MLKHALVHPPVLEHELALKGEHTETQSAKKEKKAESERGNVLMYWNKQAVSKQTVHKSVKEENGKENSSQFIHMEKSFRINDWMSKTNQSFKQTYTG